MAVTKGGGNESVDNADTGDALQCREKEPGDTILGKLNRYHLTYRCNYRWKQEEEQHPANARYVKKKSTDGEDERKRNLQTNNQVPPFHKCESIASAILCGGMQYTHFSARLQRANPQWAIDSSCDTLTHDRSSLAVTILNEYT